jgi:hypothetical protein
MNTASAHTATSAQASRSKKFLIIANMRTGSTWLETALGALSDVSTDFEMKWGNFADSSSHHLLLSQTDKSVSQALDQIGDASVLGSKLIFDTDHVVDSEFEEFTARITPDVRILHLTRSYRDIFLSVRKGYYHAINAKKAALIGSRLRERLTTAPAYQGPPTAMPVAPSTCLRETMNLLRNDQRSHALAALRSPYMVVDYSDVEHRFLEIARFVGSKASEKEIRDCIKSPPTKKLPMTAADALVSNMRELDPILEAADMIRREDLGLPLTPRLHAKRWHRVASSYLRIQYAAGHIRRLATRLR